MNQPVTAANDPGASQLLRAIARIDGSVASHQIASLVDQVSDWDNLFQLAHEHRVLPILYSRLSQPGVHVPPAALKYLREQYERNVLHSMANAAELIDLLDAFKQEEIPAMPFKGVVLSASVYHDLTIRSAGDLDFVIRRRDLQTVTSILLAKGYTRVTPEISRHEKKFSLNSEDTFQRESDGMVTELRWQFGLARFARDLGLDWVWPKREITVLAGAEVPNLDPGTMLIVLCMHGAKHHWSRLLWICDVAHLLSNHPDLNWPAVIKEARKLGLQRFVALGVLLAQKVSGVTVPELVLQRFEADQLALQLSRHIEATLFGAPGSTPECRVPYVLRMLSFRDRLGAIFSMQILQPNERDSAFLPLPKSLHLLYYAVRPFRILLDRSPRF